jgi:uncharacterized protein (UPF0147 family)
MKFNVSITDMEIFEKLCKVLVDITKDERVPLVVRNEVVDKANEILESNRR